MIFLHNDIPVFFPYQKLFPEQHDYIIEVLNSLQTNGPSLLEMPSGTGKTISLLSAVISYQIFFKYNSSSFCPKILYCSRTVGEIEKVLDEIKVFVDYVNKCAAEYFETEKLTGLAKNGPDTSTFDAKEKISENSDEKNPKNFNFPNLNNDNNFSQNINEKNLYQNIKKTINMPDYYNFIQNKFDYLGIGLTSKKNLCINEYARSSPFSIDVTCQRLIKQVEKDKNCQYYLNLDPENPNPKQNLNLNSFNGTYTLEDIKLLAKNKNLCPYYLCRCLVPISDITVFTFNYLINPRCSSVIKMFEKQNTVVIFDEAHNIDNVCIESMSIDIRRKDVDDAHECIKFVQNEIENTKVNDVLERERNKMKNDRMKDVDGYILYREDSKIKENNGNFTREIDSIANKKRKLEKIKEKNVILDDKSEINKTILERSAEKNQDFDNKKINEKVVNFSEFSKISNKSLFFEDENTDYQFAPGNIRNGIHFISTLKRVTEYLRTKLKTTHSTTESTSSLCQSINDLTLVNKETLSFLSTRLGVLCGTLKLDGKIDLSPLTKICDFLTLSSIYKKGFSIIYEPFDSELKLKNVVFSPVIRLYCLDPSIAMKRLQGYRNIIITSGTLTPFDIFSKILGITPVREKVIKINLDRNIISPLIVTKGNDQMTMKMNDESELINDNLNVNMSNINKNKQDNNTISSSFSLRNNPSVIRNYGTLIYEFSKIVPDGLIVFFPSYTFLEECIIEWSSTLIIKKIQKNKLVFIESKNIQETELAILNYKKGCENGRGAILFAIARGKVSEGMDFKDCHGRCVIVVGMPYQYNLSIKLKKRMEYMQAEKNISNSEFLRCDAMTQVAQCLGRVIRGKNDYGLMVLADCRYVKKGKSVGLPMWIEEWISDNNINLSVDMAVSIGKKFYREIAQEWE